VPVPTPTPPFVVVVVLLEEVGFVAVVLDEVGDVVVVEDVVGLVVVEVVVVVVVVVLLVALLLDELVVVLVLWQSRAARSPMVAAPWPRFCTSVVLTVEGRFATALLNDRAALDAGPHWPAATAEESDAS
jgi:hypothetical protein